MKKLFAALICTVLLAAALTGCGSVEGGEGDGVSVVASSFAPYDFVRTLLGERGEAKLLLPPGTEAHSYEPTPKDVIGIQNCDLFVYVGGESEGWLSGVLEDVGESVRRVTLMDCVELLEEETVEGMESGEEPEHAEGAEYDEHVWTSPRNAVLICEKLCDALCEADPEGEDYYRANLKAYSDELAKLDAAFEEVVENGVRDTFVFADRFPLRYFAEAYDLDYYAAWPGCADDAEPSAATVAFLIDKVKAEGIPVVFHIELANEDMADTVCAETGAKKLEFNACHNVTRAQMDDNVTYLDLMWENVDVLREALN
ncbi:MAG: metal ABC transporter substrate-binding protein [Oscillospiraceae bacterium]